MIKSFWSDVEAETCKDDLDLRVYTSRLLGKDATLVLHGGGNTSVKIDENGEEILYVKGSGWDLATIERPGFAPVKMSTLLEMAELERLSDTDMVSGQKAAMTNKEAPNPSVEAILHAIIPFKFVDHTHSDAVITITNTPNGKEKIEEIFGEEILIIPYVMPGFILAREIYKMTKGKDWKKYKGMILLNHGVFSFSDSAQESYENMIAIVKKAEEYLDNKGTKIAPAALGRTAKESEIKTIEATISKYAQNDVVVKYNASPLAQFYSMQENLESFATKGPLTPDHVIRTKKEPMIFTDDFERALKEYMANYEAYFKRNSVSHHVMLSPLPKWAIWKGYGILTFGKDGKECNIINDIAEHTMESILKAQKIGGWVALSEKDIFDMEYWELEQAKLKKK